MQAATFDWKKLRQPQPIGSVYAKHPKTKRLSPVKMASNSLALALSASVALELCKGASAPRHGQLGAMTPVGFLIQQDPRRSAMKLVLRNHRADEIKHDRLATMVVLG